MACDLTMFYDPVTFRWLVLMHRFGGMDLQSFASCPLLSRCADIRSRDKKQAQFVTRLSSDLTTARK